MAGIWIGLLMSKTNLILKLSIGVIIQKTFLKYFLSVDHLYIVNGIEAFLV